MRIFIFTILYLWISSFLCAQTPNDGQWIPSNLVETAERSGEVFPAVSAFERSTQYATFEAHPMVPKALTKGMFLTMKPSMKEDLTEAGAYAFSMEIPTTDGIQTLRLVQVQLTKPGLVVRTSSMGSLSLDLGKHYRGIIEGDENSIVAISVFDNEIAGFFSSSQVNGNYVIGKLREEGSETHIVYNDADLKNVEAFGCGNVHDGEPYPQGALLPVLPAEDVGDCVNVYVEVNFNTYQNNGSSTANTTNYITSLFNQSITLYANENINMEVSDIFIWTSTSPYSGGSSTMRTQFQNQTSSINGDIGHLISYLSSGAGGIAAGFSGICNSNVDQSLCVTQTTTAFNTVPTYSRSVKVVTHEMGHLLGSRHTHACVWNGNNTAIDGCALSTEGSCAVPSIPAGFEGTIMSYCDSRGTAPINFNLGFGPQPGNVIRNSVANGSCLAPCGTTGGNCSSTVTSFPYSEGFESGLGAWQQGTGDDMDWTRRSGGTPSSGTGPTAAAAGTWYMYMETSTPNYPTKNAYLNGPCFNLSGISSPEIKFQYHALGGSVGTMRLQASTDGASWTTIWSFSGTQGSNWNNATVSLNAYTSQTELRLRFFGTSSTSWQGDMCIDDILVQAAGGPSCANTVTSYPYTEGFESGTGVWTQAAGDDFDWTRRSGGTPSSGTGPSGAAAGTWYMYVETSSPNYPTKTAIFNGPCFNLTSVSDPEISFQYHMLGTAVGTLSLQASTNGTSWANVWSQSGSQGSAWNPEGVSLAAYTSQSALRLRFVGTSGTSWSGDLCIDDLRVGEATAPCPTINFNNYTVTAYGNGQDGGTSTIQDGGATLLLQNNAWKDISYSYSVTSSTIIEFDFRSTTQGEIHGIGFDTDENISSNLTFKVHGTQNWGITNYDNYSGTAWTTYTIPVGNFYTGNFTKLFFVMDKDGSPQTSNSYFRNVKVYENSCGDTDNVLPPVTAALIGNDGEFQTQVFPNPFKESLSVILPYMETGQEATISIYSTVGSLVFRQTYATNGQTVEINPNAPSGMYIVKVEAGTLQEELKVIKSR